MKYYKLTAEEFKQFQEFKKRQEALDNENTKYSRKVSLTRNELKIKQMKREIKFKEIQLNSDNLMEKHDGFLDYAKPKFFLQNEIDETTQKISELEEQNKLLKEEMEKDVHSD